MTTTVTSSSPEITDWAMLLLGQVGEVIGPYGGEPLTIERIRHVIGRRFGERAAANLKIEVTYH